MQKLIDTQIPELIHSNEILDSNPHTLLENRELKLEISKLLSQLRPKEEIVMREKFYRGRKIGEVAIKLCVSAKRIRQIQSNALRKLKHSGRNGNLRRMLF